jgi:hypothetical protein
MAKKSPGAPRTSSGITNEYIKAKTGLRPLTAAEHKRLGLAASKRLYTSQKPGVKKLNPEKLTPRRQARQGALLYARTQEGMGAKVTLEAEAKRNKGKNRGRSHMTTYQQTLNDFSKQTGRKKGELRKDKSFKSLYKDYKSESRAPGATRKRLEALRELDPINAEYYSRLLERY